MRTQLTKKAALLVVTASLLACPFAPSVTVAAPLQSALPVSSLASGASVKLNTNSANLARHSTSKITETPAPAVAAPAKQQDKKTIGRCWKRLMDMMREVRQAHHNKK